MGAETQFTPIPAVAHLKVELGLAAAEKNIAIWRLAIWTDLKPIFVTTTTCWEPRRNY